MLNMFQNKRNTLCIVTCNPNVCGSEREPGQICSKDQPQQQQTVDRTKE